MNKPHRIQKSVLIGAVGDLALGDHPARVGNGIGSIISIEGCEYPFEKISKLLSKYQVLIANLEYPLKKTPKVISLRNSQCISDPGNAKVLSDMGFNVINVANNHIAQHGFNNYLKTISLLNQHGIKTAGIAEENNRRVRPVVVDCEEIRIGVLGYSMRPRQHFAITPPYAEGEPAEMVKNVRTLKSEVDHVIVSVHWGDEFIEKPAPEEIALGRQLIDNGASIILGHHPHVLRGIEKYKGGFIAYSLGNFICDMAWEKRLRESMILEIEVSASEIRGFNIIPIFIDDFCRPGLIMDQVERGRFFMRQENRNLHVEKVKSEYTPERYKREAMEELAVNRKATHKYFLKNINQYKPKIIFQQIIQSMKSKFDDTFNL